ncbi:DeoR/GlpR transcriptional regulator [Facklamia sp. DSM 111018]|uniref:DeoR/GlpR transcriptional regulator n=1 Tax=Facklamia lactis TaxID=2749967 RepID=A0ABS0LS04_9LACT|nr:DeoR/GlpR family DNA-binding transcription regulator [Facklamia lactis]MBG9981144.1 DeoR/GlpR transcriptional regulator [Facklamia lactis]MBG9986945.1 DeoR/GlpR transcriptional regulator [Facklamia lactis]
MKKKRLDQLIAFLSEHTTVTIQELADQFNLSTMTIRRDLKELEKMDLVRRSQGVVTFNTFENVEMDYNIRWQTNLQYKQKIAQQAREWIKNGDTILLDSGTTTCCLAKELYDFQDLTVITNDLNILKILLNYEHLTVIFAGGNVGLSSGMRVCSGYYTQEFLKQFRVNTAFIGVMSLDMEAGLFHSTADLALTKKEMVGIANRKIVLVDNSKFNKRTSFKICDIQEIDHIITNRFEKENKPLFSENIDITYV